MSYKTDLQSNNSELSANNVDLQSLIDQANALPDAGGVEKPTISVASSGLITATANNLSSTYQLAFQAAKTITPSSVSQIAVSSGYYTGGNITVAAIPSQYVVPSGTLTISTNGTHNVKNYASAVVNVASSGGSGEATEWSEAEDAMVTGTLSSYTNDRVTTIGSCAFYSCKGLTSVNFPTCTTIGDDAFRHCSNLTTISFSACTSIGSNAFNGCHSLTTASFSACTSIGSNAFNGCHSLTAASFPACTTINDYAFGFCSKLTTASFPACTTISRSAFRYCSNLTTISFSACTSIGSYAFNDCRSLTAVSFPACTSIGMYAFLECFMLSQFYLAGSSLCTLSNSNVFSSTPYAGYSTYFSGTPYIYVPSSLIASYKTATNWTYFSSYFSAIEGGGDTGGGDTGGGDTGGGDTGGGDTGGLITFSIEGTSYQAETGMTWAEWCESEYNTGAFWYDEGGSMNILDRFETMCVCDSNDYNVTGSDVIQNGGAYFAGEIIV